MRILLVIAIVLAIVALICLVAPTTIAGAGWPTWLVASWLSFLLDAATGGRWVFSGTPRAQA